MSVRRRRRFFYRRTIWRRLRALPATWAISQGRLLFSEEMAVLSNRFRDVTVTLAGPAPLPRGSSRRVAGAADGGLRGALCGQRVSRWRERARSGGECLRACAMWSPRGDAAAGDFSGDCEGGANPKIRAAGRSEREASSMNQVLHIFKQGHTPAVAGDSLCGGHDAGVRADGSERLEGFHDQRCVSACKTSSASWRC